MIRVGLMECESHERTTCNRMCGNGWADLLGADERFLQQETIVKFLVDTSPAKMEGLIKHPLVLGQLLTPLTRYADAGGVYAVDNGAFSRFLEKDFTSLCERQARAKDRCLFVAMPDVVGNARRTLEIWRYRHQHKFGDGFPLSKSLPLDIGIAHFVRLRFQCCIFWQHLKNNQ